MCFLACAGVYPLLSESKNHKESGDSPKASWHLGVPATQRGTFMRPKSPHSEWVDWDLKRKMKFLSVSSCKQIVIVGMQIWKLSIFGSHVTWTHTVLKCDSLNTSAFTAWKNADTHHRMKAQLQTFFFKFLKETWQLGVNNFAEHQKTWITWQVTACLYNWHKG